MSGAVTAANALTAGWAAAACDGSGTVLSGAGVWPLLALLAAGADGPARAELEGALGLDADAATVGARTLIEAIDGADSAQAALGLWTARRLPVEQGWLDLLPPATHGTLSGDLHADKRTLDAWAAEHTDGLIPAMPVDLNPAILLVLASALALRTEWRKPFTDQRWPVSQGYWLGGDPIAGLGRDNTDLDMLSIVDSADGPLTVVRVEGKHDVDVHLAFGPQDRAPGAVVAGGIAALDPALPRVGGSSLDFGMPGPGITVTESARVTRPTLRLRTPRFRVTGSHDLLARKDLFGLVTAADGRGHFPGISDMSMCVDKARQNAVATFSATGFEAAAVTVIGMRTAAMTRAAAGVRLVTVSLDRPFGFLAVHRPSGIVLVAGWVAEPERRTD